MFESRGFLGCVSELLLNVCDGALCGASAFHD